MIEGRYLVNERITINDLTGTVREFNLRVTQIRDDKGRLITIPNGVIGTIANHSREDAREVVLVPLLYSIDPTMASVTITTELSRLLPQSGTNSSIVIPGIKSLSVLGIEGFSVDHYRLGIELTCTPDQATNATRILREHLIKVMATMYNNQVTKAEDAVNSEPENNDK